MIRTSALAMLATLLLASSATAQTNRRHVHQPDFFPFSVWYSGGKARAPMLSELTPESREEWRRDLANIKQLGFNTVRTWIEWSSVERRPGEYDLANL
ncbi:MAG TPA: beta-galactosidase, partial [Longimicrobiales bacterium]